MSEPYYADESVTEPTRYLIAETSTHDERRIIADWDGEIHQTREAAEAELVHANGRGGSGCCDGQHWRLYAVVPIGVPRCGICGIRVGRDESICFACAAPDS